MRMWFLFYAKLLPTFKYKKNTNFYVTFEVVYSGENIFQRFEIGGNSRQVLFAELMNTVLKIW